MAAFDALIIDDREQERVSQKKMVDPDLVPDYQELSQGLHDALAEYLALCKPRRRPAKRAARKRKARTTAKQATSRRKSTRKTGPAKKTAG